MTNANWTRTVRRLRRMATELANYGFEVIEPPSLDTPPAKRGTSGGPVPRTVAVILGEHGPEHLVDRSGRRL
jgi:hypothetical protein